MVNPCWPRELGPSSKSEPRFRSPNHYRRDPRARLVDPSSSIAVARQTAARRTTASRRAPAAGEPYRPVRPISQLRDQLLRYIQTLHSTASSVLCCLQHVPRKDPDIPPRSDTLLRASRAAAEAFLAALDSLRASSAPPSRRPTHPPCLRPAATTPLKVDPGLWTRAADGHVAYLGAIGRLAIGCGAAARRSPPLPGVPVTHGRMCAGTRNSPRHREHRRPLPAGGLKWIRTTPSARHRAQGDSRPCLG